MTKRYLFLLLSLILILCLCVPASAHSGKTDASGGHYDNSTGEYHYHHGYPAHSHVGGCPYDYDDKTDHSFGGSTSSGSSTEGCSEIFDGEVIVIVFVVLIIGAIAFCFWLTSGSSSSKSSSNSAPKPSVPKPAALVGSQAVTAKDTKISDLESEIMSLKRKNRDLQESIQYKDSLLKKNDLVITELRGTDSQKKISELNTKIMWLSRDNEKLQSRVSSLTRQHEQYTKEKEAEIKRLKSEATPASQSELDRLQSIVIDQQLKIQRLQQEIDNTSDRRIQTSELTKKVSVLELINKTHEKTISALKVELATARKATHESAPFAEEERRHYENQIEKLKEELKEPTYYKNLFTSSLRKLEKEGDNLFYNYPSVHDFLRQVTDKRFHRAMIEDIAISGKIQIQASVRSSESTYTTSLQNCNCVDYQRTHSPCKHMLYLAYHTGILMIHQDDAKKSMKTYLDKLQKTPVPKK